MSAHRSAAYVAEPASWTQGAVLAQGAAGVVYRATNAAGHEAALKILTERGEQASRRFEREIATLDRLHHPRIPRLLGHGYTEDGLPWLATEFVEGDTLAELLGAGRRIGDPARIIEQIGDALAHAHRCGIVHRDVSPRNIIVDETGAWLVDFGIAHLDAAPQLTSHDSALGTLAYAAPEQLAGGECSPASDLYGLAACAVALLTGVPPHPGGAPAEILARRLNGEQRELAARTSHGAALAALLNPALRELPIERPAAIDAWSSELAEAIDRLPGDPSDHLGACEVARTYELNAPRGAVPRRTAPSLRRLSAVLLLTAFAASTTWALADRSPATPRRQGGPSLAAGGASLDLPSAWLTIAGARGEQRATQRTTGLTISLHAPLRGTTVPDWAIAPARRVPRKAGGELLAWRQSTRARLLLPSGRGGAAILDCQGIDAVGDACVRLAQQVRVAEAPARPAASGLARRVRLALSILDGRWTAARLDHRDDAELARRARQRTEAARAIDRLTREGWQHVPEVTRVAAALAASATAIGHHAARRTTSSWGALLDSERLLARRLAALRLLLGTQRTTSLRQAPALPRASSAPQRAGTAEASSSAPTSTPRSTAQPSTSTPQRSSQPTPRPSPSQDSTATEEQPVVVGPAL